MSDLIAKAVLNGDASGLVAAGNAGAAGLDKVAVAAKAAAGASAQLEAASAASAVALQGEATAADLAALAIGEGTKNRLTEVAALKAMADGSANELARLSALSTAQNEYNSTAAQASVLLANGALTNEQYGKAIDAASVKLAAARVWHDESSAAMRAEHDAAVAIASGLVGFGQTAEQAGQSAGRLERQIATLSQTTGVGVLNVRGLRAAFDLLVDNPAVAAILLVTAATVGLVVAEEQHAQSITHLDLQLKTHAAVLAQTGRQVGVYVDAVANAGDVSERAARQMAADATDAGLSPNAWATLASAARGYATVTGTDVPTAFKTLAIATKGGTEGISALNDEYGFLDAAQLKAVKSLGQQGDKFAQQQAIAIALKNKFGDLGGEVTALGVIVDSTGKKFDEFWDKIGKGDLIGTILGGIGYGGIAEEAAKNAAKNAQAASDDLAKTQKDDAAKFIQGVIDQYDVFGTQLDLIADQIKGTKDSIAKGGPDEKAAGERALTLLEQQRTKVLKEQHDALLNLDDAAKAHEDTIKRLILTQGPQAILQAKEQADASVAQAVAYDGTTQSLKASSDQLEIQRATLPYVTAQAYAHGKSLQQLKGFVDELTGSMKSQQQAEKDLAALEDARSGFAGLTEFYAAGLKNGAQLLDPLQTQAESQRVYLAQVDQITADHADAIKANNDRLANASPGSLDELNKAVLDYQNFADEIDQVFNHKLATAYQDDQARRTDWAAGVTRSLNALQKTTTNWAQTSAQAVTDISAEVQTDFIDLLNGSAKDAVQRFGEFVVQEFEKIAYQKYLAGSIDGLIGDVVSGIGDFLGLGSGSSVAAGVHHSGIASGTVGDPSTVRFVHPAYFDDAPRRHGGGTADRAGIDYDAGERPVIVKKDEIIATPQQWHDQAGSTIVNLPASAPPQINFSFNGPSNLTASANAPRQNASGGWDVDVLIDQIDNGLADRSRNGRSRYTRELENSHKIGRTP